MGAEGQKKYVDELKQMQKDYEAKFKEFQKTVEGKKYLRLKAAFDKKSKDSDGQVCAYSLALRTPRC